MFKLALELGLPIYACCIVGNENLPDRSFRFRTGVIRIAFLREFSAAEVRRTPNAFVLKNAVREAIMQGMESLEEGEKRSDYEI